MRKRWFQTHQLEQLHVLWQEIPTNACFFQQMRCFEKHAHITSYAWVYLIYTYKAVSTTPLRIKKRVGARNSKTCVFFLKNLGNGIMKWDQIMKNQGNGIKSRYSTHNDPISLYI